MKQPLLFTVLVLLFSRLTFAQSAEVKGIVIDQQTNLPLEFCSVALMPGDGLTVSAGTLTKAKGDFILTKLSAGTYSIKVVFVGYETKALKNITLINGQKLNLGNILLSPGSKLLNEIKVSGQKATLSNKIDKQVYKADQFQTAKGGSAIDVIKNMPSVSVNSQGEVTMRGSSGFLILINGKPVQVDAETILNQLPANAIENIELITSPSAKYDADGKGGIINITTKKGADNGISVAVNAQGGLPSLNYFNNVAAPVRFGGDATINYKADKWDISVGGNYLRNDIAGRREGDVYTTVANRYTTFPSVGERSFLRHNYAARADIVYTADKNNVFTLGFYHGSRTQYRLADLIYNNTKTDINTGKTIGQITYYNNNLVKRQGDFTLANLDYNHTFNDKSTLTLSGLFEYDVLAGYTHNRNLNYPDTTILQQYTANTNSNPLHGYRLQADHAVTIGPGKLESGYQFKYQLQHGTFLTQLQTGNSGALLTQSDNLADVKNTVQAFYTQYSGKTSKLQYSGGLRYEYSTRDFSTAQTQGLYTLYLSNLFPSANLLYTFNDSWKVKTGYSKRIQRTNFNELNPYPEREHSETLEQGDPNLLPEFVSLEELGVIKTINKGSFFATLYHQDIANAINRVNKVFTDTILYRIYTNAGKANLWGLETGADLKLNKSWQLYLGANLYNYNIKGDLFGNSVIVNNSSWNYAINGNTNIVLGKTSSIQFNLNYLSAKATAQGKDSRFIIPNSSFKQSLMKGRLTATLQWQDMDFGFLNTNQQRITTFGTNFYTSTNYIQETNIFLLNISFNINQLSKKSKLPGSEFGDKEF
jgi:outer membrane receptor protein involved in Fe transport